MKVYDVSKMASMEKTREYVLGSKALDTHACYLIYGTMQPGEKDRLVRPGSGHEEIICVVSGDALLRGEGESLRLGVGHAIHLRGEQTMHMDNVSGSDPLVYIAAGGHSEHHSH